MLVMKVVKQHSAMPAQITLLKLQNFSTRAVPTLIRLTREMDHRWIGPFTCHHQNFARGSKASAGNVTMYGQTGTRRRANPRHEGPKKLKRNQNEFFASSFALFAASRLSLNSRLQNNLHQPRLLIMQPFKPRRAFAQRRDRTNQPANVNLPAGHQFYTRGIFAIARARTQQR